MTFAWISAAWPLAGLTRALSWLVENFGGPGLLLVAVADSSFLTIPEGNDLLIVVLSSGKPWGEMAYYVAMTTVGSVVGCMLLYGVGRRGGAPILRRKFSEETIVRVERLLERYGVLTLFVPSLLPPPCPFKIFVLTAGVFKLRVAEFIAVIAAGRTLRYAMWGVVAVVYGDRAKGYITENLPGMGIALFTVFVVTVAVIVFLQWRRRAGRRA